MALKRLHGDHTLNSTTLDYLRGLGTDEIVQSLRNDGDERLRIRPDGTVIQGNHRIKVLEERHYDIDSLYYIAEIIPKDDIAPWEK